LFFTVGGISQLRHLQHLKHFTKIFRALNNELVASEEVLVWAGLEAGAQTTAISAGTMYSLGQYNETILPTQAQRDAQAEANKVFLYIALVASGGSVYCRYKAVSAAKQALIDGAGVVAMPEDVKAVLQTLVGESANAVVSFETKLSTLPQLENANVITTRYASYTDDLKNAFYRDFGSIKNTETEFWNALNKTSTLDNWEELKELAVLERNEISIITNTTLTDSYVTWYKLPTRDVLERAKFDNRIFFLKEFANETPDFIAKFIQKPEKITEIIDGNGFRRSILSEAKYLWLKNDFNANQIEDLYEHFIAIRNKIKEPNKPHHNIAHDWIKNYSLANKEKAINYLKNAERVSLGDYIEKPAINYIKSNLASFEEGYVSVNINFYDVNNNLLNKSAFRDIDGLIFNNNSRKFEKIKSCKFPSNKTSWVEERDILLAYGNLPLNDNALIANFIETNARLKKFDMKKYISKIESFKFELIDVKNKQKFLMNASDFQQKVKNNYMQSDIIEINPSSFNTTGDEIIEGTYQYLNKKYNQTNSWD
jgi:hypothetical protein